MIIPYSGFFAFTSVLYSSQKNKDKQIWPFSKYEVVELILNELKRVHSIAQIFNTKIQQKILGA